MSFFFSESVLSNKIHNNRFATFAKPLGTDQKVYCYSITGTRPRKFLNYVLNVYF